MNEWLEVVKIGVIVLGVYLCLSAVLSFIKDMKLLEKAKVSMKEVEDEENPEE